MKMNKTFGICLLSVSLLALGGCAANPSSHNANPPAGSSAGTAGGSATASGGSQQTGTGGTQASGSGRSGGASGPSQGGGSSTSGDTGSAGSGTSAGSPAPATQQEALTRTAAALDTKVPVMLPTAVPVAQGKYLTAVTHSETWYYNAKFYETAQPTAIDDANAGGDNPVAEVEGTEYKDAAAAKASISGSMQINPPKDMAIDLGHGIVGIGEGATGHSFIEWNEGRWTLRIDSPSDPSYQSPNYSDRKKVAEEMVAYLNDHALPAPQEIGVVTANIWQNNTKTTVLWQYHEMTYQVTSQDPLTALKVAVAMKFAQ